MADYTALVVRPDYLANGYDPVDFLICHVTADTPKAAAELARIDASEADSDDDTHIDPDDYWVQAVFEGTLQILHMD